MRRRAGLLLLALALLVTGCWDRAEIEETAFPVALGIDNGVGQEYRWTFVLGRSDQGTTHGGHHGSPEIKTALITVQGQTLEEAIQILQSSLGRIVSLHQIRYIIFGEAVARQGLEPLIHQFLRHNEVRRSMGVSVSRGPVIRLMPAFNPPIDANPNKIQEGLLTVQKRVHLAPPIRFQHFYGRLATSGVDPILSVEALNLEAMQPQEAPLPGLGDASRTAGELPRHGGNPVEFAGTAVFRRDRMVGFLNINETSAVLALRGEMGKVYQSVPDPFAPGNFVSIRFGQENKPQFRTAFVNGKPTVRVKLQLEGEILAVPPGIDYTLPAHRQRLEQAIARGAEERLYAPLLRKVYGEWGADPMGFGLLFRKRFRTIDQWLDYDWSSHVCDLQVTATVNVFIRRYGLILGGQRPQ